MTRAAVSAAESRGFGNTQHSTYAGYRNVSGCSELADRKPPIPSSSDFLGVPIFHMPDLKFITRAHIIIILIGMYQVRLSHRADDRVLKIDFSVFGL